MTWRDLIITPAIEGLLFFISIKAGLYTYRQRPDLFLAFIVSYATLIFGTVVVLIILRRIAPVREGKFSREEEPGRFYVWKLHQFLSLINLYIHYQNSLLPPPIRKFFSRLLGAKMGKGLISIGGLMIDPYLIEVQENAMIGRDVLILPSILDQKELTLRRIVVKSGAVIGARSVLLPGVTVGKSAMVKAMSLVPEGTVIGDYEIWGGIPAQKMGEIPRPETPAEPRFGAWRDMVISPLVELFLLTLSGWGAWCVVSKYGGGLFVAMLAGYIFLVASTIIFIRILQAIYPFRSGTFSFEKQPEVCYLWNLKEFLCIMNLFIHYQNGLVPSSLQKLFMWLLGMPWKTRNGLLSASGVITDPSLVELEEGVILHHDAFLLPHAVAVDSLVLKKISIKRGALIGARAMIMPGVTVGEYAQVLPMSLVTMDKTIPSYEIWGGVPARKVGEVPRMSREVEGSYSTTNIWDRVITIGVEIFLGFLAWQGMKIVEKFLTLDLFGKILVLYLLFSLATIVVLMFIRTIFPFWQGVYRQKEYPAIFTIWRLHAFLCITNLFLFYQNGLLPPPLRKFFIMLLGARVRLNDVLSIGGIVADPYFFSIDDNAMILTDVLIMPVCIGQGEIRLKKIELRERAIVCERVILMPGVRVGEGAYVMPMSWVQEDTKIGPGEIWAGIPAQKVGMVNES